MIDWFTFSFQFQTYHHNQISNISTFPLLDSFPYILLKLPITTPWLWFFTGRSDISCWYLWFVTFRSHKSSISPFSVSAPLSLHRSVDISFPSLISISNPSNIQIMTNGSSNKTHIFQTTKLSYPRHYISHLLHHWHPIFHHHPPPPPQSWWLHCFL